MNQAEIGAAVVSRRKALGITQRQLAEIAGISRATLSALESPLEQRGVTLSTLLTVATALGLSVSLGS